MSPSLFYLISDKNSNKPSNKNSSLQPYRRNLCFCRHDNNMSDIPSVLGGTVAAGAQDDYRLPTTVYPNVGLYLIDCETWLISIVSTMTL